MPDRERVGSHPRSGVSTPEYGEPKEKVTKYGGVRRLLLAYMDQLEQILLIRSNDIHALEKFADLVRITVVKLQAEGKDAELGDGTLHSLMVKKCLIGSWKIIAAGYTNAREKNQSQLSETSRRGQIPI